MNNIFLLILFLIIIYLIDRKILQPGMILFYILIILIWKISTVKKENFNQYLYLGKNPNSNSFTKYLYDNNEKIYTSTNYYNNSNCTLENQNKSCIILPNNINLFPTHLKKQNVPKKSNHHKNITEKFSVIYPNISNQKYSESTGLQSKTPKECCPQGYDFDIKKNKCKQFCRGCKTGICEKSGWCFSNTCGNNKYENYFI